MKKIIIISVPVIIAVGVAISLAFVMIMSAFYELNPLWKSDEELKDYLLDITPIGTSMEDAENAVKKKFDLEYGISVNMESGYKINSEGRRYSYRPDESYTIVGEKSIKFYLGYDVFHSVHAEYAFDKDDKLIDILVTKFLQLI